jgi:hypothetical protein
MGSVEIREYTKRDLKGLLADEGFWAQPRLPITRRRALSHISNPRADDNDTLLITARNLQGELVSYVGVLPDLLRNGSEKPVKFGWLTAWWADRESQDRLASTMVLFAAMKKYANQVAASFPSRDAVRVYAATKHFQECARFDLSYFVLALPPSVPLAGLATRWISGAKNRLIFGGKLKKRGLEIQTITSFDGALDSFLDRWSARDSLPRDSSCWHWILEFPWMSSGAEDEAAQKNYEFSAFSDDFRQVPVLVKRNGATIAFLLMTLRGGRMYLKYAYYESGDSADVAAALLTIIADMNPWLFMSADTVLNSVLQKSFPFCLARRHKSASVYGAKALAWPAEFRPQYGIGDIVFT